MTDQSAQMQHAQKHLEGIKGHLEKLREILPVETLTGLTVKINDQREMLVCCPDPADPTRTICV